jgi:hypothetical protein
MIHHRKISGFLLATTAAFAAANNLSCGKNTPGAQPAGTSIQSKDLIGKWRLVRADGNRPADLYIQSQEIEIAADGTLTSHIAVQPPQWAGIPIFLTAREPGR